jgi:DNA mismatch endonuclease (patch repair protein)
MDGCFWHGCSEHYVEPKTNTRYWVNKISTNQRRDRDTDAKLEAEGWRVLRFWEHEDPQEAAKTIQDEVIRLRQLAPFSRSRN